MVVKQFDGARMDSMIEVAADSPVLLPEPAPQAMRLEAVLSALGDPVRLLIVRQLHQAGTPKACGSFGLAGGQPPPQPPLQGPARGGRAAPACGGPRAPQRAAGGGPREALPGPARQRP